jgi:uncharacterized protein (TIGR02145 family)
MKQFSIAVWLVWLLTACDHNGSGGGNDMHTIGNNTIEEHGTNSNSTETSTNSLARLQLRFLYVGDTYMKVEASGGDEDGVEKLTLSRVRNANRDDVETESFNLEGEANFTQVYTFRNLYSQRGYTIVAVLTSIHGGTSQVEETIKTIVDATDPAPQEEESDTSTITYNGKTWLNKNLGASRVATSLIDAQAYGDLYQWGRRADGHEKRSSDTTTVQATDSANAGSSFITTTSSPYDWLATQDDTLWNPTGTGANEVCPNGYRLPTEAEFGSFTDGDDAFTKLKLTYAGNRNNNSASLFNVGTAGHYWTSSVGGEPSRSLHIYSSGSHFNSSYRAIGFSVRCIAN